MNNYEEIKDWYNTKKIENTIEQLRENGFDAFCFNDKKELIAKVLEFIPKKAFVGIGGSVTIRELGIPELLKKRGNEIADHWEARNRGVTKKEINKIAYNQTKSDVFITSTNAITQSGKLINMDGGGQRVTSMIFGPKKVLVIAGVNKIVNNIDEGNKRIRNIVAPMNHKRRNLDTPCTKTGKCIDCKAKDSGCRMTAVLHRIPRNAKITIYIINDNLGF